MLWEVVKVFYISSSFSPNFQKTVLVTSKLSAIESIPLKWKAPLSACVMASDDLNCPSDYPFPNLLSHWMIFVKLAPKKGINWEAGKPLLGAEHLVAFKSEFSWESEKMKSPFWNNTNRRLLSWNEYAHGRAKDYPSQVQSATPFTGKKLIAERMLRSPLFPRIEKGEGRGIAWWWE